MKVFNMSGGTLSLVCAAILTALVGLTGAGINDNGYRVVIQYPTGHTIVKFDPGFYLTGWGTTTSYKDAGTFAFGGDGEGAKNATIAAEAIPVRYNDGGLGSVEGIVRWTLPTDEQTMLSLHKQFRSQNGVAHNLVKQTVEESLNFTAALMSSEESYAEKREPFKRYAREQTEVGSYATEQKTLCEETAAGNRECREIADVRKKDGKVVFSGTSPLKDYQVRTPQFQIKKWDYESKTLQQISTKREATMAIITAKAEAERAKQDAITAEQKGLADVKKAQYEKEVEKIKAVVEAQKEQEVAVVQAEKEVKVNEQLKLAAAEDKLRAKEEKQAAIYRGEGEAEARRLVLEADNALQIKADTEIAIHKEWADAYSKRQVPQYVFGGSDGNGGTPVGGDQEVANFMKLLTVDAAKRLNYDRSVK